MARVLVVEDETSVAQFIARALDTAGHNVELAEDGGAGYRLAMDEHFDLLISDIRLPVVDGIALALALSGAQPELPILLMTGFSDKFEHATDLDDFTAGLLLKPFSMDELLDAVDGALAGSANGAPLTPAG